jgi:quaternary ammonium compound-resistance protein SugE
VAWLILVIAGLLEVVWAYSMKQSEGFTRLWPSMVMLAAALASFVLLSWSMRSLPLGTAYMAWTGIGAVGAFVVGIIFLGEERPRPLAGRPPFRSHRYCSNWREQPLRRLQCPPLLRCMLQGICVDDRLASDLNRL